MHSAVVEQVSTQKLTPVSEDRSYPYGGSTFQGFVDDSFLCCKTPDPGKFYREMDDEFLKLTGGKVEAWIKAKKGSDPIKTGEELHRLVKKSIRKFSLDRGFEFANVVTTGERQCFLQSVLIAGILQEAGFDAGVAMVWKNIAGQTTNNGHAVCVLRTDSKHLVVVDASEPMPFPTHQGLFLLNKQSKHYAFVLPNYLPDARIDSFKLNGQQNAIDPSQFDFLDTPFLLSQFDYYRGERAVGGILDPRANSAGLKASQSYFEKAERECANNPLVVWMLSRTFRKQGDDGAADSALGRAKGLYRSFGWMPG